MNEPEREGVEKIFLSLLIAGIVFSMGGTVVIGSTLAVRSFQAAAAAAAGSGSSKLAPDDCKKILDKAKAEKDPKKKAQLMEQWKKCAKKQCPNKPQVTGGKSVCKADKDCQTFCEENRTGGKVDCCMGGPKEKPACLDRVEGKCIKGPQKQTPKSGAKQPPMGQGQGKQGGGDGLPQFPQPQKSPKPPSPPPQDKKKTICYPNGNCAECDEDGKNCKPASGGSAPDS